MSPTDVFMEDPCPSGLPEILTLAHFGLGWRGCSLLVATYTYTDVCTYIYTYRHMHGIHLDRTPSTLSAPRRV